MNSPGSPTRRDVNKARTQQAIVDAVYSMLADEAPEALTADRVADAADISRRTFFNYFPSVEAVIAFRVGQIHGRLYDALAARPADESLLDSAQAVVSELFDVTELADATVAWRACERSPGAVRLMLEATQESIAELATHWASGRLTGGSQVDPLRIRVLTAAMLTAFDVARLDWLSRHDGLIDTAARADFVHAVEQAFDSLRPAVEAIQTRVTPSPAAQNCPTAQN